MGLGMWDPEFRKARGFSLVEVLVALFLISLGLLAAAPMFIYAMQGNAVGADLGTVGAVAVERMELLRSTNYGVLTAGGSLAGNVNGYFDNSNPAVTVRWTIADSTVGAVTMKTITVRALANRQVVGQRKDITMTTERGKGG
jgi:prepilin-type N-terminal cleavage/methylation domain-containing protein